MFHSLEEKPSFVFRSKCERERSCINFISPRFHVLDTLKNTRIHNQVLGFFKETKFVLTQYSTMTTLPERNSTPFARRFDDICPSRIAVCDAVSKMARAWLCWRLMVSSEDVKVYQKLSIELTSFSYNFLSGSAKELELPR